MDTGVAAVLAATLVVAAGVQGLVGLGLGLVSAPVVALVAPQLMPDLLLWLALVMPLVTLVREHHEIDWRGLAWSLPSRIPGTAVGVGLVAVISPETMGILVGSMVLLSVLLTATAVDIPVNVRTLSSAGFVSGITGTTTSIGGPPMALLYQHRTPRQIRSTLALYFIAGAALSLVGLAVAGTLDRSTFLLALALVPALVVGFALSRLLDRWVPRRHIRSGVLLVCALSAVAVLVRSLLTM
ncbi:MAG TPA: sulfite exporter TauE/SafE family protein [Nocardioidaceae bacterium]|nr:sulfite exporter TauE/SafE family protein [Nocardioidaceae bacterium]